MNKITLLKIKTLSLTGFRCFVDETVFRMDKLTLISGSNGKGKTSIAHAIAYAFYGLTFFGEQAIERLMNLHAKRVEVAVEFEDQDGKLHNLSRSRCGGKTSLTYDSFTIRQADIDTIFCEKDVFLSVFNPLYFIERIADRGREFLQKYLPVISNNEVSAQMSEYEQNILSDIQFNNPDDAVKYYREKKRQIEDALAVSAGQLELLNKQAAEKEGRYDESRHALEQAKAPLARLTEKQFSGIDVGNLSIQKNALEDALQNISALYGEIKAAQAKLDTLNTKQYVSPYHTHLAELAASIKVMAGKHNELKKRIESMKIGDRCPVCHVQVTPQSVAQIKTELQKDLQEITSQGKELVSQQKELFALDAKSKATFQQFKTDDIAKAQEKLLDLETRKAAVNSDRLREEIRRIEETLCYGNLSAEELSEMSTLQADVIAYEADLRAMDMQNPAQEAAMLKKQMEMLEQETKNAEQTISALQSFIAKRAEITLAPLQMPNVQLQLFELVRSTGELKDVFRFTYKGVDYRSLSLSERVRAGLEVSMLLRNLTGLDYPVYIDNTESIAVLDRQVLPAQVFLSKVVKGAELSVTANRGEPIPLKKAG